MTRLGRYKAEHPVLSRISPSPYTLSPYFALPPLAMSAPPSPHPLASRPALQAVVDRLHAISVEQEIAGQKAGNAQYPITLKYHHHFKEKLVALDKDKAWDMYLILRAINARRVVEGQSTGLYASLRH